MGRGSPVSGTRDLALKVVTTKGASTAPDHLSYNDAHICFEYHHATPRMLDVFKHDGAKVLSVIWIDGGDTVILTHRGAPWEHYLRRVAKGC